MKNLKKIGVMIVMTLLFCGFLTAQVYTIKRTTETGYAVYDYPCTKVNLFVTTIYPHVFTSDYVHSSITADTGWKVRIYSNHDIRSTKLRKPLIVTQGFDPAFGGEDQFDFSKFEASLSEQYSSSTLARTISSTSTGNTFLREMYNKGYEIVLVLYKNPNTSIFNNSWAFQGVMWYVYNQLASKSTPLQIIGPSMGGLISRYALQTIRDRWPGITIPAVSHFIAFDSPNRGAVIPMGIQAFVNYVGYDDTGVVKTMKDNLFSAGAKEMMLYFYNPPNGYGRETDSGNQTITNYEDAASVHGNFMFYMNHPYFLEILKNYNNYSTVPNLQLFTIAVASGSGNGSTQGVPRDTQIGEAFMEKESGHWYLPNLDVAEIYMYSGKGNTTTTGSTLYSKKVFDGDIDGWGSDRGQDHYLFYFTEPVFLEGTPGGKRSTYKQIHDSWDAYEDGFNSSWEYWNNSFVNHAFIPTMSALGFLKEKSTTWDANKPSAWYKSFSSYTGWTSHSIFDKLYVPTLNQTHCMVTEQNRVWFTNELAVNHYK